MWFVMPGWARARMKGWHRVDRNIDNKSSGRKVEEIKTESLWMNFKPEV